MSGCHRLTYLASQHVNSWNLFKLVHFRISYILSATACCSHFNDCHKSNEIKPTKCEDLFVFPSKTTIVQLARLACLEALKCLLNAAMEGVVKLAIQDVCKVFWS